MSRYPWARQFIRQARFFSLLLVLCGLVYIGLQSWNLYNEIRTESYRPNQEVAESLQTVSRTMQQSRDIISKFQLTTGGPPIPASINGDLKWPPACDSLASLGVAYDELTNAESSVGELKQFLVASVQQQLNDIVKQLRAHAAALNPDSGANAPSAPPPPPQAEIIPGLHGLFDADVTPEEAEQRKVQLQQVEDLLKVLAQRTEKPENQAKLQASTAEVSRLTGLLAYLTVPAEIKESTANLQPAPDATAAPAPEVEAAKVADLIESSQGIIEETITSKWLVDDDINAAKPLIQQEQKAAEEANDKLQTLYIGFCEQIFVILLVTGILAYLVEIAADILQAHIDTADNSFQA